VRVVDRLGVFKALGDSTRYAIYLELTRAACPLSTAELAGRLDLHPNTVRPHLERMREVGLLEMSVDSHGAVGRPQHRWSVEGAVPALGLEPGGFRLLAHLLADVAVRSGLGDAELQAIGRVQGAERTRPGDQMSSDVGPPSGASCLQAVVDQLAELGFDPAVEEHAGHAVVAFSRCPFRELAAVFPDVVCRLHHGLTEGLLDGLSAGGAARLELRSFATLLDEDPCRVEFAVH
jgi:predicted ArsR family transcriptional regulator